MLEWYDHPHELLFYYDSIYYFDHPWKVDFEIPSSTPEMILDGFLTKYWLCNCTCESTPAQDPLKQYLPNQSEQLL